MEEANMVVESNKISADENNLNEQAGINAGVKSVGKTIQRRFLWLLVVLAILAADQITKYIVMENLQEGFNTPVISGLFYITHIQNQGAAFGMFADLPDGWRELILTALGGLALALVIMYSLKLMPNEWFAQLALHMIFAGAIGNLTDRFMHGSVTDFILFRGRGWSFPAFNVADSAIVLGVGLLLLDTLIPWNRRKSKTAVVAGDPGADALNAAVDMELSGVKMPESMSQMAEHPEGNEGANDENVPESDS